MFGIQNDALTEFQVTYFRLSRASSYIFPKYVSKVRKVRGKVSGKQAKHVRIKLSRKSINDQIKYVQTLRNSVFKPPQCEPKNARKSNKKPMQSIQSQLCRDGIEYAEPQEVKIKRIKQVESQKVPADVVALTPLHRTASLGSGLLLSYPTALITPSPFVRPSRKMSLSPMQTYSLFPMSVAFLACLSGLFLRRGENSRSLVKPKRNRCPVSSPDILPIDVDDCAGLGDRADVEHGLVVWLDGGGVG